MVIIGGKWWPDNYLHADLKELGVVISEILGDRVMRATLTPHGPTGIGINSQEAWERLRQRVAEKEMSMEHEETVAPTAEVQEITILTLRSDGRPALTLGDIEAFCWKARRAGFDADSTPTAEGVNNILRRIEISRTVTE